MSWMNDPMADAIHAAVCQHIYDKESALSATHAVYKAVRAKMAEIEASQKRRPDLYQVGFPDVRRLVYARSASEAIKKANEAEMEIYHEWVRAHGNAPNPTKHHTAWKIVFKDGVGFKDDR